MLTNWSHTLSDITKYCPLYVGIQTFYIYTKTFLKLLGTNWGLNAENFGTWFSVSNYTKWKKKYLHQKEQLYKYLKLLEIGINNILHSIRVQGNYWTVFFFAFITSKFEHFNIFAPVFYREYINCTNKLGFTLNSIQTITYSLDRLILLIIFNQATVSRTS